MVNRVLVIDDSRTQHDLFECYASIYDTIELKHANDIEAALSAIKTDEPDLILLDSRLHPHNDFTKTIPLIRERSYEGPIVVISADVTSPVFAQIDQFPNCAAVDKSAFGLGSFESIIQSNIEVAKSA